MVELKKNQFFNDLGDKEEIRDRYAIRDKFLRPVKIIKWCAAQKVTNCMELEDKSRYRDQHMRMITDWMLWNQYKCINGEIKISGRNVQREKFKKVLWSSAYTIALTQTVATLQCILQTILVFRFEHWDHVIQTNMWSRKHPLSSKLNGIYSVFISIKLQRTSIKVFITNCIIYLFL